ncbi:RteC domain-containing protein [Parabacteroides sp. OttesenSCG-928-K15]|nr:RteC domain-containing protein [Parabacteroides sp. OttesenSCG-928-K15]
MNNFLQELNKETLYKVRQIEISEKDVLRKYYAIALVYAGANSKLKDFIINYEFNDEQEEIYFFKQVKPKIVSQLIYHCQVYNIEMNRPLGGLDVQREYLNRELENLQDYIDRRPEFYSYYRLGSTQNDVSYFTRGKFEIGLQYLEPTISEREPKYSTNCDYKLAKILANERLEIMLKSQLDELEHPGEKAQLVWNTKKKYLIVLLYALDSYRAFGKIPLARVVKAIEKLMGVNLGNYTSIFSEMKENEDVTRFLDELKSALLQRINRPKNKRRK